MRPAITPRPYTARRATGGSVKPTPRMSNGIRVCCRRLVMWAARHRSHQHRSCVTPMRTSWVMQSGKYLSSKFQEASPSQKENSNEKTWGHTGVNFYFRCGSTDCVVCETLPRGKRTIRFRGHEY